MENKIDYEVEGCWTSKEIKTRCRLCGTKLQLVPREGHYNSEFWGLERNDGLILACCPKNCDVKEAEKKIVSYLKIKNYCTNDSKSWNYKLDYNEINDAWIDRKGKVYPLALRGHIDFCLERNIEENTLEKQGWLKLSAKEFFWERKLSKKQINIIFDYIMIVGIKEDIKDFKDRIDRETGWLKIKK